MRNALVTGAMLLLHAAVLVSQQAELRPLDHDVYDGWNRIMDERLSHDGRWLLYALVPQDGDALLHIRAVQGETVFSIPRGRAARFSPDGSSVVFLIKPELALERQAKLEKKKPDEQPKDSLGILDLATGEIVRVARVKSFAVPEDAGSWVAYLLEEAQEGTAEEEDTTATEPEAPAEPEEPASEEQEEIDEDEKEQDREDGTMLVLRSLSTGSEFRYEYVMEYAFAANGEWLAFATSTEDESGDGAWVVDPRDGEAVAILEGPGVYKSLAFAEDGDQLAVLTNRDDYEADQPAFALVHWRVGGDVTVLATVGTEGVPAGWWVSEHGTPSFSDNGERLFFGTAPKPEPEPEEETPEWEDVKVDVWNWRDPLLQPMQLVQREDELKRAYRAVVHLRSGRIVQLADEMLPEVEVVRDGDGAVGFGTSDVPYRQRISWDWPSYVDVYVVDVASGERRLLLEELQGSADISPEGRWVYWWDGHERAWLAMPSDGGDHVNLTAAIPFRVDDEEHDHPMLPFSYGSAGWTDGDRSFLVYDRYDVWATDPRRPSEPRNLTEGVGRAEELRFRYVRLDPEEEGIPRDEPIILSTFDRTTKASGFYRDRVTGTDRPQRLVMQGVRFGSPDKAKDADVVLLTRESFREFPDLWVTDLSFGDMRKLSDANPQMSEYRWGTAELVHWRSTDGRPLDGMLFKPDGFDPTEQYPMMVYFYETMSDWLHRFSSPGPGGSSVSVSFYVSRGYVVFVPDVHYRIGYPGESALDCVVPGVLHVVAQGYVDPERIGVQGHSWGGYQIAYMVTQTDLFAAAEAGAPVSNMTSAYGGIRWGSGMSRMFQYERSQSRIGGSLWEARPQYIENSPVFWADKIDTPVLMLHNDEDGAVPWYQGIEFFVALRRLGKPVWMLNYNGEAHGLRKYQNRKDWAVRMQQFFDHYLMSALPPVWLADGVPAVDKGKTLGLDLLETGAMAEGGR
jgi:dipeptidyl aminopeptidase/acylaminoacyl peptidase